MLNHTYTSVKNANVVDCGKKEKIPSQPFPLLRDNYLGEYRTELDKKKVLANLGIATDLSLEWEYIKGDIGRSVALMGELDSRTKYTSTIDGFTKTVIDGILYLESVVGGEQEGEEEQNERLTNLETASKDLSDKLTELKTYLEETIEVDIDTLEESLKDITEKVNNITDLILVSSKAGNALKLLTDKDVEEGETPGLYVPNLATEVNAATSDITELKTKVNNIDKSLETFVTKDELGGGDFDFVDSDDFDNYVKETDGTLEHLQKLLDQTVKTDSEGHVTKLYVNEISNNNSTNNTIKITDSFEMTEGVPLDIRFVKETLEDLYALPVEVCYPGMGVVVNALSALYILRRPAEGVEFNQEYIANSNNWKCPEDLVTVAMTRQEYEDLKEEEINPNVFYYIYEEEITRTQEPKREEYETDEQFQKEWQKWVDSLKTLSLEYMSAAWGVDIENKLGKKASSQSVTLLKKEIDNIKGNGNNPSLESLNKSILELQTKDEDFKDRVDEILRKADEVEQGRLVDVENEVAKVQDSLSDYITKDYIQDESNNFIFVKDSLYQLDKVELKESLATKVETKEVVTDSLKLQEKLLQIKDNKLLLEESIIASIDDIPVMEVLPQAEYDRRLKTGDVKNHIYYYTYDGDIRLITSEDLSKASNRLQKQIDVLFLGGTAEDIENTLGTVFLPIETWNKFYLEYQLLSELVQSLEQRMIQIEASSIMHTGSSIYVSGNPERCYYEDDTVYIESDLLTFE